MSIGRVSTPLGVPASASGVASANAATSGGDERGDVADGGHTAQDVVSPERSVADHQPEFDGDHPVGTARAGRVTCWASVVTRPWRFVVVPAFSPYTDCGEHDVGILGGLGRNVSTTGSGGPRRTPGGRDRCRGSRRADRLRAARGSSMRALGSSRECRHGVMVGVAGARPSDSAPTTLPRRSVGSTLAVGTASSSVCSAATVAAGDSARFARPTTTTTSPLARAVRRCRGRRAPWPRRRAGARARRRTGLPCGRGHPRVEGRELDDATAALFGGIAQPQVEHGELFLEIRAEQQDRLRVGGVVDRRAVETEHLGGQAVAELGVTVGVPMHRRAAPRRRRPRSCRARRRAMPRCRDHRRRRRRRSWWRRRAAPCSTTSRRARLRLHQGRAETVVAVDGLEVEATAVAQPAPVHRVGVDALVAQQLVAARLHDGPAADRAGGAGRSPAVRGPTVGP